MPHPPTNTDAWPKASREADAKRLRDELSSHVAITPLGDDPQYIALTAALAGNSAYLARLLGKYPELLAAFLNDGATHVWRKLLGNDAFAGGDDIDQPALMKQLRELKAKAALLIAMADVTGAWNLARVTAALTELAEKSVTLGLRFLLTRAVQRGELAPVDPTAPERNSGIIVLGMGKLGGHELNYSSDIDLIVLFEREKLPYVGTRNAQQFMIKLTTDLVAILEERTADGYVFRTDLRLRPDPMSTPVAVTTAAALSYYETVGQNWERAAMIKARPIAGDLEAGQHFLQELIPFLWRKTLDFATIADIHSIKRQMNVKGGKDIVLPGHNIKTGIGGIREIEFFVATQQLVWGGRIPELRVRATLDGLNKLTQYCLVQPSVRDTLTECYQQLRQIEHRLQMRNDEQTHLLPKEDEAFAENAIFCGFTDSDAFTENCLSILQRVHGIYTESMQDAPPLAVDGNLVFTGVEADPDTLETLRRLGYQEPQRVSDIIQGWHRGSRRSTRSKRSRQVLTELIPALLTALGKTANPDVAFYHFDDFIARLPSGAQIFSLFLSRPEMLSLLADILGSAPALGDTLSNNPPLLDSVLETDFFLGLPSKEELENLVIDRLRFAPGFEQKMIYLRSFNNEKRFQAGVHLLKRLASPKRVGAFLSDIAEVILQCVLQEVHAEYQNAQTRLNFSSPPEGEPKSASDLSAEALAKAEAPRNAVGGHSTSTNSGSAIDIVPPTKSQGRFGSPPRGELALPPFVILALGKLGGREMTFDSDLDIVFLYDDAGDAASDMRHHVIRLSQRLISALTLLTSEGRLYDVDTRLRPGGTDGPLAVSLTAFDAYFMNSAWTYERMALTRARTVASNDASFAETVDACVARHVLAPRDSAVLLQDVVDMRGRIAREFQTKNPWALKHIRGGMVDLDFIAQYLILREAPTHPALWHKSARAVFETAAAEHRIDADIAATLIEAKKFFTDLLSLLRLSAPGGVITDDAPDGLKRLLVDAMKLEDFEALKQRVLTHEAAVTAVFARMEAGEL